MADTVAERLARRSRFVTILSLVVLTLLAWAWLLQGVGADAKPMDRMAGHAMPPDASQWLLVVAMWWVMMIAMMVPSAAPVILLFGRVQRQNTARPRTAAFLAGYLAVWLGFALLATGLQQMLEQGGLVSAMSMASLDPWLSGGFLIAAGLYQLSPLKDSCLSSCRTPTDFLTRHYRPGGLGALRMGVIHGAFCVGCCWLLMALLFVGGVMNLLWIAALTMLVAAEKLLPYGEWIARLAGAALVVWGIVTLLA